MYLPYKRQQYLRYIIVTIKLTLIVLIHIKYTIVPKGLFLLCQNHQSLINNNDGMIPKLDKYKIEAN